MTEKEKKFLSDIVNSIELIESFINGINSFEVYSKDLKTKGAVATPWNNWRSGKQISKRIKIR